VLGQTSSAHTTQKKPGHQSQSRGLRLPVLPFSLGIVCGVALAGPIPHLLGSSLAGLMEAPKEKLAAIVNPFANGQRQVLVLGTDRVADNTDVMFTVQVKDGSTRLTQVPRDTFVESEQLGVVKANAVYAFGGVDAVKEEVGRLLNAPVERYVRINLRAVERLADALGGIEVDVPKRMYYVDNAQGLYIDLYPGPQVLKGESLEGFLRFRHDEMGDLGRMERQKLVLSQVFRKLVSPTMLAELPELLRIAGEDIQTDLSPIEMGQLLSAMTNTQLSSAQVPGRLFWHNDLSYWMPDSNIHYPAPTAAEGDLGMAEGQL
jgi:LCP family protein required for cell wall assembly